MQIVNQDLTFSATDLAKHLVKPVAGLMEKGHRPVHHELIAGDP